VELPPPPFPPLPPPLLPDPVDCGVSSTVLHPWAAVTLPFHVSDVFDVAERECVPTLTLETTIDASPEHDEGLAVRYAVNLPAKAPSTNTSIDAQPVLCVV